MTTVVFVVVFVLGPIYGAILWMVARLPLWVLVPLLGIVTSPYILNWERLMRGGIKFAATPRIVLITVVSALTAAIIFQTLALFLAGNSANAQVLKFPIGLTVFVVSAVAVLSI